MDCNFVPSPQSCEGKHLEQGVLLQTQFQIDCISGVLVWSKSALRKKNQKLPYYQTTLPCDIHEFSSSGVSRLQTLQMRHVPIASNYLITVQNATNHFWNFTVPNSAVSALLPHRLLPMYYCGPRLAHKHGYILCM